jgi:hypothetical protein
LDALEQYYDELTIAGATKDTITWGWMSRSMGDNDLWKDPRYVRLRAIRLDNNTVAPVYIFYFPDVAGTGFITANSFVTTNTTWEARNLTYSSDLIPYDVAPLQCNFTAGGLRHAVCVTNRHPVTGAYSAVAAELHQLEMAWDTRGERYS